MRRKDENSIGKTTDAAKETESSIGKTADAAKRSKSTQGKTSDADKLTLIALRKSDDAIVDLALETPKIVIEYLKEATRCISKRPAPKQTPGQADCPGD
ncbi:hypothetical protein TNCT_632141 [Trichonephila clavata]|uniref:Uncharacterized protein n=1 Tax=Trichonephila clavata TaxID=2740835 RepID=A0A8X6H1H5_TRICU|nr:hypothetical protein TNCT_632141 [Trichonephila clavata]